MLILNEKKYVENLLKKHCYEKNPYFDLRMIAIYMHTYDAMDEREISELLIDELRNHCTDEYYKRRDKWHAICDKLAANTKSCKLVELENIPVTSNEIEVIKNIHDFRLERLAFTMLVMAKYNHMANNLNDGWVNYSDKIIFDYANIRCRTTDRDLMMCKLLNLGLIETPKKNTVVNERVTFIDNSNDNVVLTITDTRRLGMQYQNFVGDGKFTICERCGLIVKEGNRRPKKYCSECAREIHRETSRSSMAKIRKSLTC